MTSMPLQSLLWWPKYAGSLALSVTALALVYFISQTVIVIQRTEELADHYLRIEELRVDIRQSEEVLTMSAQMAVVTEDLKWQIRFREAESRFVNAIHETMSLARYVGATETAERVRFACEALLSRENESLDLFAHSRKVEAKAVIFSDDFSQLKSEYAARMKEYDIGLKRRKKRLFDDVIRIARRAFVVAVIALSLVLTFCIMFTVFLNRCRSALELSYEITLRQSTELLLLRERSTSVKVFQPSGGQSVPSIGEAYGPESSAPSDGNPNRE